MGEGKGGTTVVLRDLFLVFWILRGLVQGAPPGGRVLHRFRVLRPGPVLLGRPLPGGTRFLRLRDPLGRSCPLQWTWVDFRPPPWARWRWARLVFLPSRAGTYELLAGEAAGEGLLPEGGERPLPGWLPPFLLASGETCPGREVRSWRGPLLARRVLQGFGPPGSLLSWSLASLAFATGEIRLTFQVQRVGGEEGPAGLLEVPLPPGERKALVLRGGGHVGGGRWQVLPPGALLEPGEARRSKLLLLPPGPSRGVPAGWAWGDQPGEDPRVLCALPIPGAPPLLPAGKGGLGGQDRALGKALRKWVARSAAWKDPRDRGDSKDAAGAWTNLEFDTPWALVLQYLRTGNPEYLEGALFLLDHQVSTDRAFLDRPGSVLGLSLVHGRTHRGRGTETGHTWIQGLLAAALLSGEEDLLEACAATVRALALAVQDGGGGGISRSLGWPAKAFSTWLDFTRDDPAAGALARLARMAAASWEPRAGAFLLPGERAGFHRWVVPLWVQAGLLVGPARLADPESPWEDRCRLLLRPAGWKGRLPPSSLVYLEGSPPRPGKVLSLPRLALALEGTAWIAGGTKTWRRAARHLSRNLEKALRRGDARAVTLLGRAWPVVAARLQAR